MDFTSEQKKMFEKLSKNMNFDDMQKRLIDNQSKFQDAILPMLNKIKEEQEKITKPLKNKNIKIEDKNCVISLIVDGRVIFNFPKIEDGQLFYENFVDLKKNENKWWYKLFTYFKK